MVYNHSLMGEITIAAITDVPTLRRMEELQQAIWGSSERDVVPYHQLLAAAGSGGVVLGAFTANGELVGFCYGFVGVREGQPFLYSHMAGVLAEYRDRDIGFQLKQAQRRAALERGFERIVWTYDPLVSMNAYFNLHKLGAVARRYYVNYYGEMTDSLNRGLESDRLEVDWFLRSPRVEALARGEAVQRKWPDIPMALEAREWLLDLAPADPVLDLEAPALGVEIPLDFHGIRDRDIELARAWRAATREVFLHYFQRNYAAVDFILRRKGERKQGLYVLEQRGK
ncbi:MAG: GNAT family N-acetyltransferase [Armatimonadota bacterium]|nr:GNAT family N-acetyltransferase [Armatimonadota bacterium]MDR5703360.1 GNAT family N-acetyltransferase [Armatimonadota bacterium]